MLKKILLSISLVLCGQLAWADCANPANAIVAENCRTGNLESEWQISGIGDDSIQGFPTAISVNRGGTIGFKVDTESTSYRIDIYRIGYYGGRGARKITTISPSVTLPQIQPDCLADSSIRLVDCGNWGLSASWAVPANAVSGVYLARLVRQDTSSGGSHMLFVVRNDGASTDMLVQTSDTSWQAYNTYGGHSLYTAGPIRAFKISYNRPINTRGNGNETSHFFWTEYPFIRFIERNGYNVRYLSGVDTDRSGSDLLNARMFVSSGHDEYWSAAQRTNVEAARSAGVHLSFFTGNEMFWKIRWENSTDGSFTPYRTLVCYKESRETQKIDPTSTWTGTWRDPRFSPPSDGGVPENALTGTMFTVDSYRADTITVSAEEGKMRFWRNTSIASLNPGASTSLAPRVLGYEWDSDLDNGFRPPGLIDMSTTVLPVSTYLLDYGRLVGTGIATHNLTFYRHASGALVFGSGTVQWAWGLDSSHDVREAAAAPADVRMQQATINLFADMRVQPGSLQTGLSLASASGDTQGPLTSISSPANGTAYASALPITVTGSATDSGGVVGGVEVSVDGGTTWRRANGRGSWQYTWTPQASATQNSTLSVLARATDDSGNIGSWSSPISVTVNQQVCPCNAYGSSQVPGIASVSDTSPAELGMKFRVTRTGFITGVRFYKGPSNTGQHIGSLWKASTGELLGRATFTNESATGWQSVNFPEPVSVTPGTTYVTSYFAPNGGYSYAPDYFLSPPASSPVRPLRYEEEGPNGVSVGGNAFPYNGYGAASYYVDATWVDAVPNVAPRASNDSYWMNRDRMLTISPSGLLGNDSDANNDPITAIKVTDPAHGVVTVNGNGSFTYTPSTGYVGPDSFTYKVNDGVLDSNIATVNVTVNACPPCSIWPASAVPSVASVEDSAVEVGLKFRVTQAGTINGIRFYKGSGNTGTHIGNLWSASGANLASATFTNETATGWQQVLFSSPVTVAADTTYVASYFAPNGGYAVDGGYFLTKEIFTEPLRALKNGFDGGNAVFHYGGGFPDGTFNGGNYWVDVLFTPAAAAPLTAVADTYTMNFGQTMNVPSPGIRANDNSPNGSTVAMVTNTTNGTLTMNANGSFTYVPMSGFKGSDQFTYRIVSGNAQSAPGTVTISVTDCPCSLWPDSTVPSVPSLQDSSVELGVKFQLAQRGRITGIRFYKGAANTGVHVGSLWSSSGDLLAQATFTNETAAGWQRVTFSSPVNVIANTTYVASYFAPNGGYAASGNHFAAATVSTPIRALASGDDGPNGLYRYNSAPSFPTDSWSKTNYWVDVVFEPNNATPPEGKPDSFSATPGHTLIIAAPGVLSNDDGNQVTAQLVTNVTKGSLTLNSDGSFTYVPGANFSGADSFTYNAVNPFGQSGPHTVSIAACPCNLLPNSANPAIPNAQDDGVELGFKFQSTQAGYITGIRFYKGAGATGSHVVNLWTTSGTLLASAPATSETASGWQQVNFAQPIAIEAHTTYVASYHAPNGGYSFTGNYFAGAVTNGALIALSNADAGGNGVYAYGSSSIFPGSPSNSSNYWVDVVFTPTLN